MRSQYIKKIDKLSLSNDGLQSSLSPEKKNTFSKLIMHGGSFFNKSIPHKGQVSIGGKNLLVTRKLSSCVYEVGHSIPESKSVSRYALKCIPLTSLEADSFEIERRAQLEISALRRVSHENVMRLLEDEKGEVDISRFFSDSSNSSSCNTGGNGNGNRIHPEQFNYLLSPLYDTNLNSYIKTYGAIRDEGIIAQLFGGICSGVEAIHAEGMRHNDLNPRNILLRFSYEDSKILAANPESSNKITPWPVICDFESVSPVTVEISSRWQAAEVAEFHLQNSSPAYRAPEIWQIAKASKKLMDPASDGTDVTETKRRKSKVNTVIIDSRADSFSVGCILYYIMFKRHAFKKTTSLDGKFPSRWLAYIPPFHHDKVPQFLLYVSLGMMIEIPHWRLEITQVLSSILPQGKLNNTISRAIWSEYQGAPCLQDHKLLIKCRGAPLTLNVPQSPTSERNRRAVRMFGKGGTSVVKSLDILSEDSSRSQDFDDQTLETEPTTIDDFTIYGGNLDPKYEGYSENESLSTRSMTTKGLLTNESSTRSDFDSESNHDKSDSNSFISWSEFRESVKSIQDELSFPKISISRDKTETLSENRSGSYLSLLASPVSHRTPFSSLSKTARKKANTFTKSKTTPIEFLNVNQDYEQTHPVIYDEDSTNSDRSVSPPKKSLADSQTKIKSDLGDSNPSSSPRSLISKSRKERSKFQLSLEKFAASSNNSIAQRYSGFLSSPKNQNQSKDEASEFDTLEVPKMSCNDSQIITTNSYDVNSSLDKDDMADAEFNAMFAKSWNIVKKGPLRQKFGKPKKETYFKTVYLYITNDAELICRNGHGESCKVLSRDPLRESDFVDVTLIGEAAEGNGFDFAISFSKFKNPNEIRGLRLLAANEVDARSWARSIRETWESARHSEVILNSASNTDNIVLKEENNIC